MAPPQPRKGPTRVPQNPLMGGYSPYAAPYSNNGPPPAPPNSGNPLGGPGLPGAPTAAWPGGYSPYGPPNSGNPLGGPGLPGAPTAAWPGGYSPYGPPNSGNPLAGVLPKVQGWQLPGMNAAPRGYSPPVLSNQTGATAGQSPQQNPLMGGGGGASGSGGPSSPLEPGALSKMRQLDSIMRQEAARQQNTRYGDFSQTAGQAYSNGLSLRPEDMRARLAGREASMQPGGAQMQGRFAPESPLGQRAAEYQRGLTGVSRGEGVFIQRGGYGSPQDYLQFNNTPEGATAVAAENARLRREDKSAPGFRSQQQRVEQLLTGLDRRKAAIDAGLPKQRAEAKKADLQDRTLKRAVTRGLNPLSPQAQALYPEAAGRLRVARSGGAPVNPLSQDDPFRTPDGKVTADTRQEGHRLLGIATAGIPATPPDEKGKGGDPGIPQPAFFREAGLTAETDMSNIQGLHFGIQQAVQNGVEPSVEDLRMLRGVVQAIRATSEKQGYDPMDMTYGFEGPMNPVDREHTQVFSPMYKSLLGMTNPSDIQLKNWWSGFKSRIRPDTNRFIGGSAGLSGEGRAVVSPGGYEHPLYPQVGGSSGSW